MGIDVQGGGGLAVTQGSGDRPHVFAIEDQQGGVQVPELVDAVEGQVVFFAKLFQPLIRLAQSHRGSIQLCEQPPALMPLVTKGKTLTALVGLQALYQIEDPRRQLQRPAALDRFRRSGEDAVLRGIERNPLDSDGVLLVVEVMELKPAQFFPSETAEQSQSKEHLPLDRSPGQSVQKRLGFFQGVTLLLQASLQSRQRHSYTGVIVQHPCFDRIGEDVRDQGEMILDRLGCKASLRVPLIRSGLTKRIDKTLDLPGRDLIHVEMAKSVIDSRGHLLVVLQGALAQVWDDVLLEPLLREGLELDVTVPESGPAALFIEKDHLPIQFLFDLLVGHACGRRPGHGLHHLLAVRGVATEGLDAVRVTALDIRSH